MEPFVSRCGIYPTT